MSFLKNVFKSESPVSSRRIIAVWVAFVILGFVVYKGVNEDNAISFVHAFLGFLAILLGLTTYQNVKTKGFTVNPDPNKPPESDEKPK